MVAAVRRSDELAAALCYRVPILSEADVAASMRFAIEEFVETMYKRVDPADGKVRLQDVVNERDRWVRQ